MATREAPPPPLIAKAGRYTVFITPPATPRPPEASRFQNPNPRSKFSPNGKMRSNLSPKVVEKSPPPPVQVPPPQFEKGKGGKKSEGSVFGFFWDALAKVQDAHSSLDRYLADWLGLDQSRYQWALDDYYENNGVLQSATACSASFASSQSLLPVVSHQPFLANSFSAVGKDGGKPKELVGRGEVV